MSSLSWFKPRELLGLIDNVVALVGFYGSYNGTAWSVWPNEVDNIDSGGMSRRFYCIKFKLVIISFQNKLPPRLCSQEHELEGGQMVENGWKRRPKESNRRLAWKTPHYEVGFLPDRGWPTPGRLWGATKLKNKGFLNLQDPIYLSSDNLGLLFH